MMRGIFKKMMAAVAAVCMCAGLVMPMRATAAESIVYGDVNNDGVVSMADVVLFNKYLFGICDLTDYSAMDVNQNYLIDYVDRNLIQALLLGEVESLPY